MSKNQIKKKCSAFDYKLTFGKHQGKTLDTIMKEGNVSYLRYLVNWDGLRPTPRRMINEILKHEDNYETKFILPFGKYKGSSIEEIEANDPDYIDRLLCWKDLREDTRNAIVKMRNNLFVDLNIDTKP